MNLRTERLFLRPIAVSDAEALFEARGDAAVMRYWDWPAQDSVAAVREIFAAHIPELSDGATLWWVAALTPGRLRDMIDGYYAARGLDSEGRPAQASVADLHLTT